MMRAFFLLLFFIFPVRVLPSQVWIEAESFNEKGGWIIDSQFIDQMGSAYLMAHGLGEPVESAKTQVLFQEKGLYHIWIRTKDWAPSPKGSAGQFRLAINGNILPKTMGRDGDTSWHWEYVGEIEIEQSVVNIELVDLTGFNGRVDALYFSKENQSPPNSKDGLECYRNRLLRIGDFNDVGNFDVVVVGGGIAGMCAAIQASRLGLKVALVQNRPVLGGNSSSEVRLPMEGALDRNLYPRLGRIVSELNSGHIANSTEDRRRESLIRSEKNISLFLSMHVYSVEKEGNRIKAVLAKDVETNRIYRFNSLLFVDSTGDANLGVLSGAIYRSGRESWMETKEPKAPLIEDSLTMGTSNNWYAKCEDYASDFPCCPWAIQFSEEYHMKNTHSEWFWETGFYQDKVALAEEIRDYNFKLIYGHWAYLKNKKKKDFANWKLDWVAYVAGKRESRRLMGDVVLSELDINDKVEYPDACVTTTWGIDLHYPDSVNSRFFPNAEFLAFADHDRDFEPYHIPYRCLYSSNIDNLFMAGRNISVTHVALGTVRVMQTTGMMGEVVGLASFLCKKYNCVPRDIYSSHLSELKNLLSSEFDAFE